MHLNRGVPSGPCPEQFANRPAGRQSTAQPPQTADDLLRNRRWGNMIRVITSPPVPSVRPAKWPIFAVFIVALVLRLAFVFVMGQQQTSAQVLGLFPDSRRYQEGALYILGQNATGEGALLASGPGYAAFLAALFRIFGDSAWPVLATQVTLSALGCALIYLCARIALPGSQAIPLLAGLIAAFSLTSISLSGSVLTESLFFAVQAGSLCCLLYGLSRNRWPAFLAWGALAGAAVLIRPAALFWALAAFLAVALVLVTRPFRLERCLLTKAAAGLCLALLIVAGWAGRNYAVHDRWTVADVGMTTARYYWVAATLAGVEGSDVGSVRTRWQAGAGVDNGQVVLDTLRRYPWPMAKTYLATVAANATATSFLQENQLPGYRALWDSRWPVRILFRAGLLLLILATVGLLALVWRSLMALLLGVTYIYFVFISGLTFWQGSRITYPAQMAGAIFAAAGAVLLAQVVQKVAVQLLVVMRRCG
jgi:hypothetical protein